MGAPNQRGAALVDVVFVLGTMAVLSGIAIPTWQTTRQHGATRAGARYVAARLQQARIEALKRNVMVALRFDPIDLDRFAIYADGDGDGVLSSDIVAGIDTPLGADERLSNYTSQVRLFIRQEIAERDTGTLLPAGSDPLRCGSSTLISFSPLGSATSGTLYLAGASGPQMAIRIMGATGRTRVLRYDSARRQWSEQ